jgi:hypothetical protein
MVQLKQTLDILNILFSIFINPLQPNIHWLMQFIGMAVILVRIVQSTSEIKCSILEYAKQVVWT